MLKEIDKLNKLLIGKKGGTTAENEEYNNYIENEFKFNISPNSSLLQFEL